MPDITKDLASLAPLFAADVTVVVIGGMAKTGTTLPLTLLDGHPGLIAFPEELRFFHMKADRRDAARAAEKFLANGNTLRLAQGRKDYGRGDYKAHGGTGFGTLDYSMFDWDRFAAIIRAGFAAHRAPLKRFLTIIGAYQIAMGRPVPADRVVIATKAPHNERFARKWVRMLGSRGRFIQCTRDPIEHYLSLQNVSEMYDAVPVRPGDFADLVAWRQWLWGYYPAKQLYVLDYDRLIAAPEAVMREIAAFIGLPFHDALRVPTKNGQPWSGNSSRGLVGETIFANPRIARQTLPPDSQRIIERRLHRFMTRMGYAMSAPVTPGDRLADLRRRVSDALRRARH